MPRKTAAKRRAPRKKCKTITFHRGRKEVVVVRCEGKKLSTSAKARWKKQKGKVICRNKKTGVFTRCARAKRKR